MPKRPDRRLLDRQTINLHLQYTLRASDVGPTNQLQELSEATIAAVYQTLPRTASDLLNARRSPACLYAIDISPLLMHV